MYTILASETVTNVADVVKPVMTTISGSVSASDIVALVGQAVAFGIPFFLAWMGLRKIVKIATSAIKSGKISA